MILGLSMTLQTVKNEWRTFLPGCAAAAACTLLAWAASALTGLSAILCALVFGLAARPLFDSQRMRPGLNACIALLNPAIILLGLQITAHDLSNLSAPVLLTTAGGVAATVILSVAATRLTGRSTALGALAGAGVAVCGVSAVAALSLVVPRRKVGEKELIAVIMILTALSMLALVLYPAILKLMGTQGAAAGLVIGGSIHNISQVVAAGAMMGEDVIAPATMIKMLRVLCLVPMMFVFAWCFAEGDQARGGSALKQIPGFVYGFAALAAVNVLWGVPEFVARPLLELSQLLILLAVAAMGMRTAVGQVLTAGWFPLVLLTVNSVFLFVWMTFAAAWLFD